MTISKAMICDLDGTLVNTLEDLADSTNAALEQCGFPVQGLERFNQFVGNGTEMLIRRALGPENEQHWPKVKAIQQAYYAEHFLDKSRPYAGIVEALEWARAQGIALAVLTNKPDYYAGPMVHRLFRAGLFDCVLGHQEDFPLKPDPTSALAIARQLNVEPARTIFFGDSLVDMQTATNAGMIAVGAAWGFRGREELAANGAKQIVDSPDQLPKVIGELLEISV